MQLSYPDPDLTPLSFLYTSLPPSPFLSQDLKLKFRGASDLALDLLRGLLRFDPEERLTAEEALQHPFFLSLQQRDYATSYLRAPPPPSSRDQDPASSSPPSFRPVPMNADIEKMGESAANLWNNVRPIIIPTRIPYLVLYSID